MNPKSFACSSLPKLDILFRNCDVFSRGRETEYLIFIEGNSKIKIVPLGILDDYRCLGEIVQDIQDFCQKGFIGSEYLLRIEREIQPANQFLEIFILLLLVFGFQNTQSYISPTPFSRILFTHPRFKGEGVQNKKGGCT